MNRLLSDARNDNETVPSTTRPSSTVNPPHNTLPPPSQFTLPAAPPYQYTPNSQTEQFDLTEWLDPEVPGPLLSPSNNSSELSAVDKLGAWDCALSRFQTISDIPQAFRSKWAHIYDGVMRHWERGVSNQDKEAIDRALKTLLILPQLLLRQASRGGKRGQSGPGLAARFDLALQGEWSALVEQWEADLRRLEDRESRRRHTPRPEDEERKRREQVLRMISAGQISRAAKRIDSFGLGDLNNDATRASLQSKFPQRSRPLPPSVPRGQCLEGLGNILKDSMLQIVRGTASGPGGGRGEYLICLAQQWNAEQFRRFENFSMQFLHGETPPWFGKVMRAISTIAAYKTKETNPDQVRPIGVLHEICRFLDSISAAQNRAVVDEYLHPVQLGIAKAGAHKLIHTMRMSSELPRGDNWILVKLDFKNAHSEVSRAAVLEELTRNPTIRHLAQHHASKLAPSTILVYRDKQWRVSAGDGQIQGDPEAGQAFNIAIQPDLVQLDAEVSASGGLARAGQDDVFVVGPSHAVFPAIDNSQVFQTMVLSPETVSTEEINRSRF